jgi:hypothetical protein
MPDGWLLEASLAGNPFVTGHRDYVIKTLLHGMTGSATRMTPLSSRDDESIAALATFIRSGFTNGASPVRAADVAKVRRETAGRSAPWTHDELVASVPARLTPDRGWIVTASHTAPIVVGSTGDPFSAFNYEGWTTGVPQETGMWFQIEMPEVVLLTEIEFQSPTEGRPGQGRRRSAPLRLRIEGSLDGARSTTLAEVSPDGSAGTAVAFDPVRVRYLRFTQVGEAAADAPRWTMHRLKIFAAPEP